MESQQIRSYFLASQDEHGPEEIALTADLEIFETAEQIESELVDDYVLGRLSSSDREAFETHYLVTQARRNKVEDAQTLRQAAIGSTLGKGTVSTVGGLSAFSARSFAIAAGFAAIAAAGVLFYLSVQKKEPTETARVETPARIEPVEEIIPRAPAASTNVDKTDNRNSSVTTKRITPATISLPSRNYRDSGREIVISKDDTQVPFLLKLETEPGAQFFSKYSVVIETPEGQSVTADVTVVARRKDGITVSVKGEFNSGTYIVYLAGIDKNGANQPVEEYAFRVVDK